MNRGLIALALVALLNSMVAATPVVVNRTISFAPQNGTHATYGSHHAVNVDINSDGQTDIDFWTADVDYTPTWHVDWAYISVDTGSGGILYENNSSYPNSTGAPTLARKLSIGSVVGPGSGTYSPRYSNVALSLVNTGNNNPMDLVTPEYSGHFTSGTGYVGFKFNSTSGQTHYGWAQIDGKYTLSGWGYESTPNTAITISGVTVAPEPATIMLLSLPLVLGFKRKRTA